MYKRPSMVGERNPSKRPEVRAKLGLKGDKNPSKRQEVREKISFSLKKAWAEGKIVSTSKNKKRLSILMKSIPRTKRWRQNIGKALRGIKRSDATKALIRTARMRQKFNHISKIEDLLFTFLQNLGVAQNFTAQVALPIFGTIPDFVDAERKIALYADGDYWHSRPEVIERDRRIHNRFNGSGWQYRRYTEKSLKDGSAKYYLFDFLKSIYG